MTEHTPGPWPDKTPWEELKAENERLTNVVGQLCGYPFCDCKSEECLVLNGPIPARPWREELKEEFDKQLAAQVASQRELIDELRALTWAAWFELNTIRARDGVPRDFYGHKTSVDEEYFSDLVDGLSKILGDDCKPWPQEYMKPHLSARAKAKGGNDVG